ncbi:MAG: 50S ribosomal protein L30 [Christensenellaceae bacterium]|jgi:large subunit ribosomal protein L30|nr:50S ribosomal protein L30 [Christensenellaceae bacterium]
MTTKKFIEIELVHGLTACTKRQIATAKALGLSRPRDKKVHPDNAASRGAAKKIEHLVKITEVVSK